MFLNQGTVMAPSIGNKALNSTFLELYSVFIMQNTHWNLFMYTVFISAEDLVFNFYSNKTFFIFFQTFVQEQDLNREYGPFIYSW